MADGSGCIASARVGSRQSFKNPEIHLWVFFANLIPENVLIQVQQRDHLLALVKKPTLPLHHGQPLVSEIGTH